VGIYDDLGVRRIINGMGAVTMLGGSLLPPEALTAMHEAAASFVMLEELQAAAGARIADLLGVPAAMVTSGAASAIAVATAACLTRGDAAELRALPDTSHPRDGVLVQSAHRSGYDAQLRVAGARIVEVESLADMEAAAPRAAMVFFLNYREGAGRLGVAACSAFARDHGLPLVVDAASDIPPLSRVGDLMELADLVILSGGKALRGPQSTGILLGRGELVDAARRAISPHGGIGRGMKVGKEEIAGLVAAVERFVTIDHDAEHARLAAVVDQVIASVGSVAGVHASEWVPPIANHVPHAAFEWDEDALGRTSADVVAALLAGDPAVAILDEGPGRVVVSVWMLQPGEHLVIADRLQAELS
jgi:D-glucosaminate-6-phosphate ammonia-lyase